MMSTPPDNPPQPAEGDDDTGLPILRSWRSVYVAVTIIFVVYATLLTLLTRLYR